MEAIPLEWCKLEYIIPDDKDSLKKKTKKYLTSLNSKSIRQIYIDKYFIQPKAHAFWEGKYYDNCKNNWNNVWHNLYMVKSYPRVYTTNWKILHNCYLTRVLEYY